MFPQFISKIELFYDTSYENCTARDSQSSRIEPSTLQLLMNCRSPFYHLLFLYLHPYVLFFYSFLYTCVLYFIHLFLYLALFFFFSRLYNIEGILNNIHLSCNIQVMFFCYCLLSLFWYRYVCVCIYILLAHLIFLLFSVHNFRFITAI